MSYLSSPADDMPEPCSRAPKLSISRLRRQSDDIAALLGDVARMIEGRRAGDIGFTGAGTRLTLAATKNALENYLLALKDVEAEVLPARPAPSSRLPAVASAEAF